MALRLNRYGRPYGVPRQHVNKDGVPKPAHDRETALGLALRYSYERATDEKPIAGHRHPVEAYECVVCGAWHVGTMQRHKRRRPAMMAELGDRAWWNLYAENRGSASRRLAVIARRWHRLTVTPQR